VTPESDRADDTSAVADADKRTGDDVVGESRWPMAGAVLAAMVLTILLPDEMRLGPQWVLPLIEGALLVAVIAGDPGKINRRSRWLRVLSIVLVSVLVLGALWATVQLIDDLIHGGAVTNSASELLEAGTIVWVSNNIAFALLYWELDGGGAAARAHRLPSHYGFAFPQQLNPRIASPTGGHGSSITCTWASRMRPRSARQTPCRSPPGRRSQWRCRRLSHSASSGSLSQGP
jgi:hypothetical protein